MHIIPRENSAVVQLVSRSKDVFYEEGWIKTLLGKYDTRAHTGAFVDSLKLVLLSTGFGFEAVVSSSINYDASYKHHILTT